MSTAKFCTRCGAPAHGDTFCTQCGQSFSEPSEPTHSVAAEATAIASAPGAGGVTSTDVRPESAQATATLPPPPPARSSGGPGVYPEPMASKPWTPVAISAAIVLALAGIMAIVLITTGGKPSAQAKSAAAQRVQLTETLLASRQLYAATQQSSYSALLPAGWQQVPANTTALMGATTVLSPVDGGATITVGQIAKPARTLRAQAARLLKAASSAPGYRQAVSTQSTLAGGRAAWALAYDAGGQSTAYYLVSSCKSMYAVSATVPPSRVSLLRARIAIVASTLQGNC